MEPVTEHRHRRGVQSSKSHHKIQSNRNYKKSHDDKMRKFNSEQKEKQRKQRSKEKRDKQKERDAINRNRDLEWKKDVNYYNYFGYMHKNKSYIMFPIKTKFFGLFLTKQSKLLIDRLVKQNKEIFAPIYNHFPEGIDTPSVLLDKYKNEFIKSLWKYKKHMISRDKLMNLVKNSRSSNDIPKYGFIENTIYNREYMEKCKKRYDKFFILNVNIKKLNKNDYKYNLVLDYRNIEYILFYDYSIYNYNELDRNFGFQDHKNRKITVNVPDVKPAYYFYKWKHKNCLPDDDSIRRNDYLFVYNTKHKGNSDKAPEEK